VVRYIDERTGQVSDSTIIKEVNVLKRMFHLAQERDKIGSNPAHRAPLPKAPEGRTRYLTPEQWQAVFKACWIPDGEQWLQQAAGLAVAMGTRRGELLAVTLPDVDLAKRQVTLRKTKNGRPRMVYINDLAFQVLAAMGIEERKQKQDRGVLFPGITPEQLSMRFLRAARAAGVEDFSFHDLRHTYASHLKMQGADLYDLMRLLGHSDMRSTAIYATLSQEHLRAATAKLDGVLTLPSPDDETK
jgi:site-specific recombinase XerD